MSKPLYERDEVEQTFDSRTGGGKVAIGAMQVDFSCGRTANGGELIPCVGRTVDHRRSLCTSWASSFFLSLDVGFLSISCPQLSPCSAKSTTNYPFFSSIFF